jgi:hypothetical protein
MCITRLVAMAYEQSSAGGQDAQAPHTKKATINRNGVFPRKRGEGSEFVAH